MSVRERRKYWIEKRIKKDKRLTFMDNGYSRVGIRELTFKCVLGKYTSWSVFSKSKLVFEKEFSTARFDENFDFLILKNEISDEVKVRLSLRGSKISYYDSDTYVLVLELPGRTKHKKKNSKKKFKHIKFEKLEDLCWFDLFLIEKLDCEFVSRNERSLELESRIDKKLTNCGLVGGGGGGGSFDLRILYDPDYIRHHFLSVHPIGIKYKCDIGWREGILDRRWKFHLIFSEMNYNKSIEKLYEEILNPLQSHDYILCDEDRKELQLLCSSHNNNHDDDKHFHISCSVILGNFYLDFTKIGLIIPRRALYYPLGGNISNTLHPIHFPPLLGDDQVKKEMVNTLAEFISEYNTKYVFETSSSSYYFMDQFKLDPDLKERRNDFSSLSLCRSESNIFLVVINGFQFLDSNNGITSLKQFKIPKILIFGENIITTKKQEEEEEEEEEGEMREMQLENRTSVDFVEDIIRRTFNSQTQYPLLSGHMNDEIQTYPNPNGTIDRYFQRIRKEGYINDTNVTVDPNEKTRLIEQGILTPELERKICCDPKNKNTLVFRTHLDLDEFCIKFCGFLNGVRRGFYNFPDLYNFLQCIDRVFWCRHFRNEEDKRWRPKDVPHDSDSTGCPFSHPKNYWLGFVMDDYLGST